MYTIYTILHNTFSYNNKIKLKLEDFLIIHNKKIKKYFYNKNLRTLFELFKLIFLEYFHLG